MNKKYIDYKLKYIKYKKKYLDKKKLCRWISYEDEKITRRNCLFKK